MSFCFAQMENDEIPSRSTDWFISFSYGAQISGIKSEDFIRSNLSPTIMINIGKWVSNEIGLEIGHRGFYFNFIGDTDKHYYNFLYGNVLIRLNNLLNQKIVNDRLWAITIYPGAGYFYNHYYKRPNICANLGLLYSYSFKNNFNIIIDVSAIAGWDIYQGNEDILPSSSIGITYSFQRI
jgi:hypothetical protein